MHRSVRINGQEDIGSAAVVIPKRVPNHLEGWRSEQSCQMRTNVAGTSTPVLDDSPKGLASIGRKYPRTNIYRPVTKTGFGSQPILWVGCIPTFRKTNDTMFCGIIRMALSHQVEFSLLVSCDNLQVGEPFEGFFLLIALMRFDLVQPLFDCFGCCFDGGLAISIQSCGGKRI